MRWIFVIWLSVAAFPARSCELALMFAIDVSGSINHDEWKLQTAGLADALLDPDISILLVGRNVSLSAFQWSGSAHQDFTLRWRRIETEADLAGFAGDVRALPRRWDKGKTAIGTALKRLSALFGPVSHCRRLVVDLSGDGVSNEGSGLPGARALVERARIQLNGLAIEPRDHNEVAGFKSLDVYYRENVIVGDGAFVEAADGYQDYPRAIREKLLKELGRPLS